MNLILINFILYFHSLKLVKNCYRDVIVGLCIIDDYLPAKNKLVTWGVLHGSAINHTSVLWDHHEAGIYTIVTTNIGLTVVWDRLTTVYVKLDPRHQVGLILQV